MEAVFGCGSIAQRRHIPEYAANPNVELVAYPIRKPSVQKRWQQLMEGKATLLLKNYLENEKVDAVSVCTPNYLHARMTIAAANAGAHVLVEKPMASTVEEGEQIIEAARRNSVFLMVGHNQRFMPPHVRSRLYWRLLNLKQLANLLSCSEQFFYKCSSHLRNSSVHDF
ncbi:Gfo/Idh/MocA family protein [Paenibacillus hamazuiensis]|uniref:Gfo/Idh/MocA family protein n=1 Tax=Paenibacillus hamazuiensis TaxID=2936508 RepID=UPI00200E123A|nr:Gfo/Idh/MocA family oxidoreductase [Paenibacillus hamazuiensis]